MALSGIKPPTIIVGAGGHARVVYEAALAMQLGTIVGLIDRSPKGTNVFGVPVIGGDDDLPRLRSEGITSAIVAIGDNAKRLRIGQTLASLEFDLPALIHPTAFIAPSCKVGPAAVVMARAVIGTATSVGFLAIVNTAAVIDHDGIVHYAAHIASGCALAGNVEVEECALIGVGSAIRPGVRVGARAVVGAGSAVIRDVTAGERVGGAPARTLSTRFPASRA